MRTDTCFTVVLNQHLLDPLPVLQGFNQPGQRDVIMWVSQLTGG